MDDDILFYELIKLSHAQQVEKIGWCICEFTNGEGQLADDCPRKVYKCNVCASNSWRYLHEGDESNCQCEGSECWRVCNEWNDGDGCDGSAELVEEINA